MEAAPPTDDRFTTERYFQLVEDGVIGPDDRVELLDGVIVAVPPSGPRHAAVVTSVGRALILACAGANVTVRVQTPLVASAFSAPEPDIAIVSGKDYDYFDAHPKTALLVVEVSDYSLPQDRMTKSRIYAEAGIAEYWIVNVRDRRLEVMRAPDADARVYREHRTLRRGDVVEAVAIPTLQLRVDELLPPPLEQD
jgi:Uma2 family endonuclease